MNNYNLNYFYKLNKNNLKRVKKLLIISVVLIMLTFTLFPSLSIAVSQPANPNAPPKNPEDPTTKEQNLFNQKKTRLENHKNLLPHSVDDVLNSFQNPFNISLNCSDIEGAKVDSVEISITTELIKWNATEAAKVEEGAAGVYFWNCAGKKLDKVKKIRCTNYIMLDPTLAEQQENSTLGKIFDEVLLYHELLHGQLQIDAMKNDTKWKEQMCKCELDLSKRDPKHETISTLEGQFRESLAEQEGYKIIVMKNVTSAHANGSFEVVIDISNITGKEAWSSTYYVPPNGNIDHESLKDFTKNGKLIIKGKLIDKKKKGKIEVYVDPINIGIFATVTINPHPIAVPVLTPFTILFLAILLAFISIRVIRD